MENKDALQAYIDSKIPKELQESHSRDVGFIKGGWVAAMRYLAGEIGTSETAGRHGGRLPWQSQSLRVASGKLSRSTRLSKEELIDFEHRVRELWEAGKLPYLVHLCGGNEDQLIKIFSEGHRPGDWVFSGHRSHYHYLLAGGDEERLLDLIKRGSSMFVFDKSVNFLTSSVLAGTCGIAAGVAWEIKHGAGSREQGGSDDPKLPASGSRLPHVWCFLGDGAEDEGHFYEAVCFVQGNNLPCTFVVEDNNRSVETSKEARGRYQVPWPSCVHRYHYEPTYPHAGSGCKHHIVFDETIRHS